MNNGQHSVKMIRLLVTLNVLYSVMIMVQSRRLCRSTGHYRCSTNSLAGNLPADSVLSGGGNNSVLQLINISVVQSMLSDRKAQPDYAERFSTNDTFNKHNTHRKRPKTSPDILQSSTDARTITLKHTLREERCESRPLLQRLRLRGCRSQPVLNRFCYGQCNSFYIQRERRLSAGPKQPLHAKVFESCSVCRPSVWRRQVVQFHCARRVSHQRRFLVRLVEQCQCTSVDIRY